MKGKIGHQVIWKILKQVRLENLAVVHRCRRLFATIDVYRNQTRNRVRDTTRVEEKQRNQLFPNSSLVLHIRFIFHTSTSVTIRCCVWTLKPFMIILPLTFKQRNGNHLFNFRQIPLFLGQVLWLQ